MREVAAEIEQSLTFGVEDRHWDAGFSAHEPPAVNRIVLLFTRSP